MNRPTERYPVAASGSDLARRTTMGVFVANLVVLVAQAFVETMGLDVGTSGEFSPFAAVPIVATTVVAGIGAALVYAAVVRFTARPVRNFVAVAVVVFLGMLIPVAFGTPSMGVTPTGQVVLVLYHALVGIPISAFILGAVGG